jgi:hypothetical protein
MERLSPPSGMGRVPATPPSLLAGASSRRLLIRSVVAFFMTVLFAVVGLQATRHHPPLFVLVCLLSVGLLLVAIRLLRSSERRHLAEIAHGYTHATSHSGLVTLRAWSKTKLWGNSPDDPDAGIPWDFSGLWRLSESGAVLAAPNFAVQPPGFYPSPHQSGRYELWTGCAWAGVFQR